MSLKNLLQSRKIGKFREIMIKIQESKKRFPYEWRIPFDNFLLHKQNALLSLLEGSYFLISNNAIFLRGYSSTQEQYQRVDSLGLRWTREQCCSIHCKVVRHNSSTLAVDTTVLKEVRRGSHIRLNWEWIES